MVNGVKNVVSFLVRLGLSGALLWYLFSKIDVGQIWEVLRGARLEFLVYAGLIFFVVNLILLARWFIFIKALEVTSSIRDIMRYYFVGLFGNLFLPSSIGGDFLKIYGLCRSSSQKTKVVASVLLDRLSGFAAIVLVSVMAFILGYRFLQEGVIVVPIIGMAVLAGGFACVLFNEKLYSFCCGIFSKLPKVQKALLGLHYDIALMKGKRREGFGAIAVSCLSQVVYAVCWYLIARALSQDVDLIYFLIFVPLTCVAASFPSIGGLGVREIGTVYLFGKAGMDSGVAAGISLINFLFMVIVGLIGGLVYVVTLSPGWIQYHPSDVSTRPGKACRPAPAADPVDRIL